MIRVTFFIGNGFDINVGLHTKYKEFYDYYIEQCPDDYLANKIKDDYEFWSDLEEALGKYTARVSPAEEEKFWKSEGKLEFELVKYLKQQMDQVNLKSKEKEIALELQRSLTEFYTELGEDHQQHIANIYSRTDKIVYSFISFNYTDILDRCLEEFGKIMPDNFPQYHNNNNIVHWHSIEEILHIHGTISRDMVLGVNDDTQIGNERFRKKNTYRRSLIKEEQNRSLGNSKTKKVSAIINDSTIICVFGMSIGKTDKIWWQHICRWLRDDSERRLIIYTLEDGKGKPRIKPNRDEKQEDVLTHLQQNADIYDDEWKQIEGQICVKIDPTIFDFKVV